MSGSRKGSVETSSQSAHSGQPLGGVKVAIPRLRKDDGQGPGGGRGVNEKHRVSHACEPCRQRKTKCSGERPVCRHCEDFKITCYYGDGKRDRAKNELKSLQERVNQLETLLNQVAPQLDSAGQFAVTKIMQKSPSVPSARAESSSSPSIPIASAPADIGVEGEKLASAEVGSTGSLDKLSEDINTSTVNQPSGFMGRNTDVSWLRRIERQMDEEESGDSNVRSRLGSYSAERTDHHGNVSSVVGPGSTYQLDDLNLTMSLEQGDMFGLPPKHIADALLEAFFTTIHTSFPFIAKPIFMNQYESFMMNMNLPSGSRSWLAILNIMFALGAIHSHLSHAEWRGDLKDHLQYLARARALYIDYGVLFAIPDLLHVQVLGMTGLYLAATNQPNRAWNVVGLAVRSAYSIGLHLYNDDSAISDAQKEVRVRVWYSLFILERLVAVMTGRPTAIHERYYSCPLPDANDDETVFGMQEQHGEVAQNMLSGPTSQSRRQSGSYMGTPASSTTNPTTQSSYYFIERIKLSKVAIDVLNKLYCADTVKLRWNEVQELIRVLDARLMSWLGELPSQLSFGGGKQTEFYPNARLKNLLAFEFYNTRMLLNRPCLCRVDERIPKESEQSRSFNRHAAVTCVQAAQSTLAMLPNDPDPTWLMRTGPWWCILYYLVSAGVVIIIEIAYRAEHMPDQADSLASDAEKLLNWLRALAADNLAANRSYQALSKPLADYLPRIGGSRKPWTFYRFADGNPESTSERPPKRRSSAYNETSMTDGGGQSSRGYFPPPRDGTMRTTIPVDIGPNSLFPLLSKTPYDETPPVLPSSDDPQDPLGQNNISKMFPSPQQIKRFREWQDNLLQPNYDPSLVIDGDTSAGVPSQHWWNFAHMDGSTGEQGMVQRHGSHSGDTSFLHNPVEVEPFFDATAQVPTHQDFPQDVPNHQDTDQQ